MSLVHEAERRVTQAKAHLLLKHPFLAIIALALRFRSAKEMGVRMPFPTMATDGKFVFWDENFVVNECTIYELIGVIVHEIFHCIFLHMFRRGTRDPRRWNMACDYAVNIVVLEMGFQLPEDRLYDIKYKGWKVEDIYDDLTKQEAEQPKGRPCPDGPPQPGKSDNPPVPGTQPGAGEDSDGTGNQPAAGQDGPQGRSQGWGDFIDPVKEDGTPADATEKAERQEDLKVRIVQAAQSAKTIGNLPAAFKGLIKALEKPVVDWKEYIQHWVSGHTPDDYTWNRPQRRSLGLFNIIAPSIKFSGAGIGVLSVDTSGSVSDKELRRFVTEIMGMIEVCNPEKLYIIQHDAAVSKVDTWEKGDDFDRLQIASRGGTRIRPVFQHVAEKIEDEINWMVCFTDMEINDFPTEREMPDYPVLWAATGEKHAPFGTYLAIKDAVEMAS